MFLNIQTETQRFWLKYFMGVKMSFFLTAWLKQSMSGKLCVCAHTSVKDHVVLKQMETCKH